MSWFRRHRAPTCTDFVELITDYLDGVIPVDERTRIDRHLEKCSGCSSALRQWRIVIDLSGHLTAADVDQIDDDTRLELTTAFRDAHGHPTGPGS